MTAAKKDEYSAKDIQVLENIEAIRKRPGMYIGSTDEQGWHHLAWEAIDNPVDESVAGYCQNIWVTLSADQTTITIKDDGRGIPIEIHPTTKKSTLETIFTVLHSGGKFDNKVYKTSGGLHGVGVTVVNALSQSLRVESSREEKTEILIFKKGKLISSQIIDTPEHASGVLLEFTPDKDIFKEFTYFKATTIQKRLRELAYLNPNLTLNFANSPTAEPVVYHFAGGLVNWIKEVNESEEALGEVCYEEWKEEKGDEYFQLNLAFQYNNGYEKSGVRSFCNNIRTGAGGTHVDGFETGLLKVCQELIEKKNPNLNIVRDDICEGLTAVISIRIKDPEFTGQTKDRLANKKVRELTRKATQELVSRFFQDNSATAEKVARKIINNATIRAKIKEEQTLLRTSEQEIVLPGVLAVSEEGKEIFLVEGPSAGGSAKMGREIYQDVLSLQGKIPNALKLIRRVFQNKEIRNLLSALGFSNIKEVLQNNYLRFRKKLEKENWEEELTLSEDFVYKNAEDQEQIILANIPLNWEQINTIVGESLKSLLGKTRYEKVIIMTDADDDGAHIALLLTTLIFLHLPYLIEGRKLFLSLPPLYRLETKKEAHYFYNDHELEEYRQLKGERGNLKRFKGLGEMNALQLRESSMDPNKRRVHELFFSNLQEADALIKELMGIKSAGRKRRLESGEHKGAQLVVSDNNRVEITQLALVNFLRYAYKVVEDRALPDVIDGLKPVQRRILYTIYDLGLLPNKPHKKLARVVGDVMGKYHPHGNIPIEKAAEKMVQDFNYRYPLIDGQGNFGSIDGDPAAAARYTEVRLSPYALHLLEDLKYRPTVIWRPNYDDTEEEPTDLPTKVPGLLLNGSSGIAVGMSTNIPPHNLGETLAATISLIRNPELTVTDLMNDLPAPDFPTGGVILEKGKLVSIYEKGEGTVYIRAKVEIVSLEEIKARKAKREKFKEDKKDIIWITEIPFKIKKATLVEQINRLIKEKRIDGLKLISDYSNWEGIDIRIKFDPEYDGNIILSKLFRSTRLQTNFSIKMRALLESKPQIFSLKEVLEKFIVRRLEVIERRSQFIFQENEKELDNLETRLFIINNYQQIAEIVKKHPLEEERNQQLRKNFAELSAERIARILDTPISFRQFTPEQQNKLEGKISEIKEENIKLGLLVASEEQRKEKLIAELEQLKQNYSHDQRRTKIIADSHIIDERKAMTREDLVVILSKGEKKKTKTENGENESKIDSYLNIHKVNSLEATNIHSVGKELKTRGENMAIIKSNRRDDLWCFSNLGKLYIIPVYKLTDKSTNLRETGLAKLAEGEIIEKVISVREDFFWEENKLEKYLVILTKKGKIKRLPLEKIGRVLTSGKKVIGIANRQDQISQISFSSGQDDIMVFTKQGKSKTFSEEKVRICGRSAYGDTAVKLQSANSKSRCSEHKRLIDEHKTASCCDKSQGIKAFAKCQNFKKLLKEIKNCKDCNKTLISSLEPVKNEAVDLEIVAKEQNKKELCLLAIKEDNSGIKKPLLSVFQLAKRRGGTGHKSFKTEEKQTSLYCEKHEASIIKIKTSQESINEKAKEVQRKIEDLKKILNQAQSEKVNPEVIKKYEQELIVAKEEQKRVKEKVDKKQKELENSKKKTKECADCRKNCRNHENLKIEHEKDTCCDKKKKEMEALKEKINRAKEKGVKTQTIKKHEQERKELQRISLKNRVKCPRFQMINQEIRECADCQKQKAKKAKKITPTPVKKVLLLNTFFDKELKPEIYLLVGEAICWYNKKDLVDFFQDEKKKKIQFYKDKKSFTDLNLYSK